MSEWMADEARQVIVRDGVKQRIKDWLGDEDTRTLLNDALKVIWELEDRPNKVVRALREQVNTLENELWLLRREERINPLTKIERLKAESEVLDLRLKIAAQKAQKKEAKRKA